jgi:small GTP-binding protein
MAVPAAGAGDKSYKVILLGTIEVGKTSLIVQFVEKTFTEGKLENFDKKEKTMTIEGKPVKLVMQDTAGQERFRTLTSSYYRKANAIVIVYDITNKESFDDLSGFIKEGNRYSERSEKFIVANKKDLDGTARVIPREHGESLAAEHQLPFFEVSAKTGEGVEQLFETVARKLAGMGAASASATPGTVDVSSAVSPPAKSSSSGGGGGGGGGCSI